MKNLLPFLFVLLVACDQPTPPQVEMTSYQQLSGEIDLLRAKIGVMDTVIQAQDAKIKEMEKQYNMDYAFNSTELDSIYAHLNQIEQRNAKEDGNLNRWKRFGRNVRNAVEAYKEVKSYLPI